MRKIKFLFPVLFLGLFACDNYLDVNQNPSRLPFSDIGPEKLLPAAQVSSYAVQNVTMNQLGNVFMNSWGANVQQYTGGWAREYQLLVDNSFYSNIFENLYLNVNNFQKIIEAPNPNGQNDYFVAVAKIMKAHYMQYLVDLYGDVPYTEAFKGVENITPAYNDDQFVYRQLLNELDDARDIILNSTTADDISQYDVMLAGNMQDWFNFANTIELRYLVRMSNSTGAVAAYRDQRANDLVNVYGGTFITSDVSINPGYSLNNDAQTNPFFLNFLASAAGTATQNYSFIAPTAHYYKALSTYAAYPTAAPSTEIISGSGVNYPNVNDPRRLRIFRNGASQSVFRGVTQGSTVVDMYPPGQVPGIPGRIGLGLYNPYNQTAASSVLDFAVNDGYVMLLAEAEFLQAEAALRWPALFSNDQGHFLNGIAASCAFHSVPSAAYIAAINTKVKFGWTGSFDDKLHAIMYQKWIALMGVHGIESFIEYNRTGYPLTPLATSATQTRKPRRLVYPLTEYVANTQNVPMVTPSQVFATTDPSHPFWMLGDPALGN